MATKHVSSWDDDHPSLASLDMVYSEDTMDNDMLLLQQAILHPSDVHRCNSQICQACNPKNSGPTFESCPKIDPKDVRSQILQLPKHWWDYEDVVHFNLIEIIMDFLEKTNCNCGPFLGDTDSAVSVSMDREDDDLCQPVLAAKTSITSKKKSTVDTASLTSSCLSDDSSVYIEEYRIKVTTTNDGGCHELIPFDEQYQEKS